MNTTRRGFLKLLGLATAVAASGDAVALVTTPEQVGAPGFFAFPVREILEFSIDMDEYVYRVDCMYNVPGQAGSVSFSVSAGLSGRDALSLDREKFNAMYREPMMATLRKRIREDGGFNVRALPMPDDFTTQLLEHLRA